VSHVAVVLVLWKLQRATPWDGELDPQRCLVFWLRSVWDATLITNRWGERMWQKYGRAVQAAFEHTLFGSLAEEGICSKHVGCKRGYHKCMLPKRTMQVAWLSSEIPVNNGCWLGDSIPALIRTDQLLTATKHRNALQPGTSSYLLTYKNIIIYA